MPKILITGAAGFLGSHLTRRLHAEGYTIGIIARSHSNFWRIADLLEQITVYNCDIVDTEQPFKDLGTVDAVIHTATCYGRKGESSTHVLDSNVRFPLRLLEAARKFGATTFYNTDTFFNIPDISYDYLNTYTISKRQFKEWGHLVGGLGSIQFINLRLEHMYGPDDDASKFTSYVIKSCLDNVPDLDLTVGVQKRDFIFIDDVVSAFCALLKSANRLGSTFQEYGVGSGQAISIRQFVEMVHAATNSTTRLNFGALDTRKNEIMTSNADPSALNALGWKCEVSLIEGIARTVAKKRATANC